MAYKWILSARTKLPILQNFDKIIILNLSLGMLSWITNAKLLTLPKINPRNFDLIKHKVARWRSEIDCPKRNCSKLILIRHVTDITLTSDRSRKCRYGRAIFRSLFLTVTLFVEIAWGPVKGAGEPHLKTKGRRSRIKPLTRRRPIGAWLRIYLTPKGDQFTSIKRE